MKRPEKDRMLATLLVAPFMAQADATIANVATPSIRAGLHASGPELELVIGGYLVAFAVAVCAHRSTRAVSARLSAR